MAEVFCIINPASRDGTCGKAWPKIEKRMTEMGLSVTALLTERPGHGSEIANKIRQEIESGQHPEGSFVVAVGGDGIAHEVASAMRGSTIPMGQIPFGSGNDLCITHNIPRNDLDAAIDILINGKDRMSGAWRLEGFPAENAEGYPAPIANPWDGESEQQGRIVRWVFLETDAGITSAISRAKLSRAKWIHGPKKYTWLGITMIPVWPRRKVEVRIDDGSPEIIDFTMFGACTGETFGGGYRVCPGMNPRKQKGMVILAPRLSRWKMLNLMSPMKKGKHLGKWGIRDFECTKLEFRPVENGVAYDSPKGLPTWIQADGEPLLTLPATLTWHPEQILLRGAQKVAWDES